MDLTAHMRQYHLELIMKTRQTLALRGIYAREDLFRHRSYWGCRI
jgi:hypothetical protein